MLFSLKDKVLFRQYDTYGYITDNSMFGYRFLNDKTPALKEKFVSESGSVMLGTLSRVPQEFDAIVEKLFRIFTDVDYDVLRQDTLDFFMKLTKEGYLACSDECKVSDTDTYEEMISGDDEEFHVPKKNFLRSIHFEIANACNERCLHCFIPEKYKTNIIDSELFYRILEEGRTMNIIHVTLTGGEPMLHPDFINFLRKCRELDLSVNVLSNLTLLNDEFISEMKRNALLSVQTSLYSMLPSVHDSITRLSGSFEKTKLGILKLIEAGIPVQISCQVMKQNKASFMDVVEWGHANNIPAAFNYMIFGEYDHSNENLQNRLSLDEVEEVFDRQNSRSYSEALMTEAGKKLSMNEDAHVCSVCRYYFGVTAEGDAFPCAGWQAKKLGSLREHSISEIWNDSSEVQYLRQIRLRDFPKCQSCKDRGYCTICMMTNANENTDSDMFRVSEFQCEVASMIHSKVEEYLKS